MGRSGFRVGACYVDLRSPRDLLTASGEDRFFRTEATVESGISTVRVNGWGIPKSRLLTEKLWLHLMDRATKHYVRRFGRPDVVHAHTLILGGVSAEAFSDREHVPFVTTEHSTNFGDESGKWLPRARNTDKRARASITVSRSLAADMDRALGARPRVIVPNVVDETFFTLPERVRTRTPFQFCAVALLHPVKGIDRLLHAFASAFRREPGVTLAIAGDGPERSALELLSQELGIADRVRFLGLLSRDGVRSLLWASNALVMPSKRETFGVAVVEALATGIRAIATRCGGPEEIISEEVGRLTTDSDLATALAAEVALDPPPPTAIRDYAVSRFSQAAISEALKHVYRSAIT